MEKRRQGIPGREMTWAATCGKNAGFGEQCKVRMASCGGKCGQEGPALNSSSKINFPRDQYPCVLPLTTGPFISHLKVLCKR